MRSEPLFTCFAAGVLSSCFSPSVPSGDTELSTGSTSGATSTGPGASEETAGDASSSIASESTELGTGTGEPPGEFAVSLDLSGFDGAPITNHGVRTLSAAVEGGVGDVEVDFFAGTERLGSDGEAPYTHDFAFWSANTGETTFRAVARSGEAEAEDSLVVPVAIEGGSLDDLEPNLFDAHVEMWGFGTMVIGGGVFAVDEQVYVSGMDAAGGVLLARGTSLGALWMQSFPDGIRRRVSAAGPGSLFLAAPELGNWTVREIDRLTGATSNSWIVASIPPDPAAAALGPILASFDGGVHVTTRPDQIRRYDSEGNSQSISAETDAEMFVAADVGAESVAYYAAGDPTFLSESECVAGSENCLLALDANGSSLWTAGVDELYVGNHRLAAASGGGVYLAGQRFDIGWGVTRYSANGVVLQSATGGEPANGFGEAVTLWSDRVADLGVLESGSGVVLCGTDGPAFEVQGDSFTDPTEPFVVAFDDDLSVVWEIRGFIDPSLHPFVLGCSISFDAVYVYGFQDAEILGPAPGGDNTTALLEGSAWLAKISL